MNGIGLCLAAVLFSTGLTADVRADFIVYDLGALGSAMVQVASAGRSLDRKAGDTHIVLPGKVVVQPGGIASYTHANGTQVHFRLEEGVEIKRAPTTREEFNKRFGQAGED